jgi:hypothetical protein
MGNAQDTDHFASCRLDFIISGWAPVHVHWDPDARRFVGTTRTPTAGEWAAFWAAIEAIGVWGWDGYLATFAVCDAGEWLLELADGDRAIRSSGNGSAHPPGWGGFLAALGTLIGDDRLKQRGTPTRKRAPHSGITGSGSTDSQG